MPPMGADNAYASYNRQMIEGMRKIESTLLDIFNQFEDITPEVMIEALEPTFQKTQERVPVKTGKLKRSGYLKATGTGKTPRVEMGYGYGGLPPYASIVHEIPYAHTPPTSWKYLQGPILEDKETIFRRIGKIYQESWAE